MFMIIYVEKKNQKHLFSLSFSIKKKYKQFSKEKRKQKQICENYPRKITIFKTTKKKIKEKKKQSILSSHHNVTKAYLPLFRHGGQGKKRENGGKNFDNQNGGKFLEINYYVLNHLYRNKPLIYMEHEIFQLFKYIHCLKETRGEN